MDAFDGPTAWIDHLTVVVGALPERPRQQSLSTRNVGNGLDAIAKAFGNKVGENDELVRTLDEALPSSAGVAEIESTLASLGPWMTPRFGVWRKVASLAKTRLDWLSWRINDNA
jgi:hypothetical protein